MSSWLHLLEGLLLGAGLGLFYGFLRPVRPRWLSDLAFIAALFWAWIYLGFGLCGGDLRMGYSLSLLVGIILWECTFGIFLRPVFSCFWKCFYGTFLRVWRLFKKLCKKVGDFINFLFARSKKWVTIECNQHPRKRKR